MSKEKLFPLAKRERENEVNRLLERVVDRDKFSYNEAKAYATIYQNLALGDISGKISAMRVKNFMEYFIQKDNPSIYKKMYIFYGLSEDKYDEKRRSKINDLIQNYIDGIRSVENAMSYSISFEEAANKMASKIDAPEEMSVVERVKWIRLWFIVIRNQEFFYNEIDGNGQIRGINVTRKVNNTYIFPESMISLNESFLSKLNDGEILYDMIKAFIDSYPKDVQRAVYRFAELDGVNRPDSCRLVRIRDDVKKKLFPNSWRASTLFFTCVTGIKHMIPKHLKMAVLAYKNGGIANMPVFKNEIRDVFNDYKKRKVTVYKYGETQVNGRNIELGVSGEQELMLYVNLYKWLIKHPEFKFGEENKTLEEYGLSELLLDEKEIISTWILEQGFASSEDDINWDLAKTILNPKENLSIFKDWYDGKISSDTVCEKIGFNSEKLARMCLSLNGLVLLDKNTLNQALKRVKMFGLEQSLKSDKLYVGLYEFLKETRIPCGPKKRPIASYGIKY